MEVIEAAYGAYSIANANMMRAIRAVSSERGRDPRRFVLYAFGGAGPGHAVEIARGLGIKTIIVPPVPGVCSAFGLLCADIERRYARAFDHIWEDSVLGDLNSTFDRMCNEALSTVQVWGGFAEAKPRLEKYVDLRYEGQASELLIPVPEGKLGPAQMVTVAKVFEKEYEKTYGHRLPGCRLQVANLRLLAALPKKRVTVRKELSTTTSLTANGRVLGMRKAYWGKSYGWLDTPVLQQVGQSPREGPILVDFYDTTIVVPPGCTIAVGNWGNVIINIKSEGN